MPAKYAVSPFIVPSSVWSRAPASRLSRTCASIATLIVMVARLAARWAIFSASFSACRSVRAIGAQCLPLELTILYRQPPFCE